MSRIVFAMSRNGLLSRRLSVVGVRTGAPRAAVLLSGGTLAVVASFASVQVCAAIGGFLHVMHFVLPLVSLVVLRRCGGPPATFRTPAPRVVLPLASSVCGVMLASSGRTGVLGGLVWLALGLVGHLLTYRPGPHARADADLARTGA